MTKRNKLYDVYVSYPPNVDVARINECLYDNLPEKEAESLIQALAERPQAIIAENCSQIERENAQQYFNYLGLDVIVRQALELSPENEEDNSGKPIAPAHCPVCLSIPESPEDTQCRTCLFHFSSTSEQVIQHKRIEWQEKIAFEHKRQAEISYRLYQERLLEEKRLRKQIREQLDKELQEELGGAERHPLSGKLRVSKEYVLFGLLLLLLMVVLFAVGFFAAKYL